MTNIIKRDKRIVPFNPVLIEIAINSACDAAKSNDDELAHKIATLTSDHFSGKDVVEIEKVVSFVEDELMKNCTTVARKYIEYRRDRDIARSEKSDVIRNVLGVIDQSDDETLLENANKDAAIIPTQRDMVAGAVAKEIARKHILPRHIVDAHDKGLIHYHDMDYAPAFPMVNCCLVDLKGMFEQGFKMGNADIGKPKGIMTACAITAQIIAQVASHIYGGTSIDNIDTVLAPYVEMSWKKHLHVAKDWKIADDYAYANSRTEKECFDAFQSLEYEINTLNTSNGQTPFVTFTFGSGTSKEAVLIQESILKNRIRGLGEKGKTPTFPKLVFYKENGINNKPTDPNYHVKKLAIKCSVKRLYPDYIGVESLIKATGSKKGPMGCVKGDEIITYKLSGVTFTEGFESFWNKFSSNMEVKTHDISEYIDVEHLSLMISDKNGFSKVKKIIRNPDQKNWYKLKFLGGRHLHATADHPLPVEGKGRTFVKDMVVGDEVLKVFEGEHTNTNHKFNTPDIAYALGLIICDGSYDTQLVVSLDHKSEQDVIDKLVNVFVDLYPDNKVSAKIQERTDHEYTDVKVQGAGIGKICKELESIFGGIRKNDRTIPNFIFNAPYDVRCAFLSGMMDADGYVRKCVNDSSRVEISIGTINKLLSSMQCRLFESIGINPNQTINESYNGNGGKTFVTTINIRKNPEQLSFMQCNKKTKHFGDLSGGDLRTMRNHKFAKLKSIEFLGEMGEMSYDVETVSDTFNVSGLHSHNCRSFLGVYIDPETGKEVHDGRCNLGVVSLNIPRIALESDSIEQFWSILDSRCDLVKDALETRIDRLRGVKAKVAPILYTQGAFGIRLQPEDDIMQLFENGRASISMGYIGLHETAMKMFGESPYENQESYDFTVAVVQFLRDKVDLWKEQTGFGYGLYSTPSENLCNRFCKLDIKEFGIVDEVTDHEYYTNSFHLDVAKKASPFDKFDFESVYPTIANGGFISFAEYPSMLHNELGLEIVLDHTHDKNPYTAVNVPSDQCHECGFEGETIATAKGFECPQCGNRNMDTMSVIRRICGYLGAERGVNHGKLTEITRRVKHV